MTAREIIADLVGDNPADNVGLSDDIISALAAAGYDIMPRALGHVAALREWVSGLGDEHEFLHVSLDRLEQAAKDRDVFPTLSENRP
jgi:hypothetical protein